MTIDEAETLRLRLIKARLQRKGAGPSAVPAPIIRRVDRATAPLSASQRQLWYLAQLYPESTAYNELAVLTKLGACDLDVLTQALNDFVGRHQAWRTHFVTRDGTPYQVVEDNVEYAIPLVDLSQLPRVEAEARAASLAVERLEQPFDLSGRLVRPWAVRLAPDEHRLYLAMHHLIFDGVTLYRIYLPEIAELYRARASNAPPTLPEPLVQYPDYAVWEVDQLESPAGRENLRWWREQLSDIDPPALPLDRPRPARRTHRGGMVPLRLSRSDVSALRGQAARVGTTWFQYMAAVYSMWLRDWTGSATPSFGILNDFRQRPELAGMVGYSLAPLVVRADLSADPSVGELAAQLRVTILEAMTHAVPFEPLVRELGIQRDPRVNPIFQTMFSLEPPPASAHPDWSLHVYDDAVASRFARAKFDVSIELDERSEGFVAGQLLYDTDLFEAGTAQQMADHFHWLATSVASGSAVISSATATAAAAAVAPGLTPPKQWTIIELIEKRVQQQPDVMAVAVGGRQVTYGELYDNACVVARRLTAAGAGPGVVVAIVLDRSVDLVTGLLGVVLSGAAFLPLGPDQPLDRLTYMVEDADARLLLTTQARVPIGLDLPTVFMDDGAVDPGEILPESSPADAAYVLYTSGSTGRPKGVVVEHRNLAHFMATFFPSLNVTESDIVVTVANYTFDVGIGDIFGTLAQGARVVLATSAEIADPALLAKLLDNVSATLMDATPTVWSGLVSSGWAGRPQLVAVSGGEPLSDGLAREIRRRCRGLWNAYGPTEATVWASCGEIRTGDPVHAGTGFGAYVIRVADDAGRALAPGLPGEVVIGGPGVARGYVNRPEETAARFVADPEGANGRLYRTGDRGRLMADGRLRLFGRMDDQLKVRGFRVEPGEIESVLAGHPAVAGAAVTAQPDRSGTAHLVAHVVDAGDPATDAELRDWARARLPEYMVPTRFQRIDALPLTSSGKLDRRHLTSAAREESVDAVPVTVAHTPTQRQVARIWAQLLDVQEVDVNQDFFDIGGHSLLAVRLVTRIRKQYGAEMSVGQFLEHGRTVAELAHFIDAGGVTADDDQRAPQTLFLIFPDAASSVSTRHFTSSLGEEWAIVPLNPPQTRGRYDASATVASLASDLLRRARARQPRGPYRFAGYSFGGLLAYEMACQLAGDGETTEWLGIIDTPTGPTMRTELECRSGLANRLRRFARNTPEGRAAAVRDIVGRFVRRPLIRLGVKQPGVDDFDFPGALRMALRYRNSSDVDAPLDLFVAEASIATAADETLGWAALHRGDFRLHRLPGDHVDMFRPPLVDEFAGQLLDSLRSVSAAEPLR